MELNEYQEKALSTKVYNHKWNVIYPTIKLAGEAGELSEKIGKLLRDQNPDKLDAEFLAPYKEAVLKELGDILWYVASLANDFGATLEEVAQMNVHKLASRAERGVLKGSGDDR